ncbi:MAG: ABC transporter permease [Actinobacteria bacterium]|nr:ABC transporter permease [Actinomycetota bacterium]MCL5736599.1 ABC transporter permease [Actinomycetota bacterium]
MEDASLEHSAKPPIAVRRARKADLSRRRHIVSTVGPFATLAFLVALFSILNPEFLTRGNAYSVLRASSALLMLSLGLTFVIMLASIDLSIGSIVTLVGILTAMLVPHLGVWAVFASLALGTACGLLNGVLFTYVRIPSFVVTLGTLSLFYGVSLVIDQNTAVAVTNEHFIWLADGTLLGDFPNMVLVALVAWGVCIFISQRTRFGRAVYAIGGGERMAMLSGLPVRRYKIVAFMLSGLFAGLASALLVAKFQGGNPEMGQGPMLLDAIAAVVMGGTGLTGGVGGPHRTILGALVLAVLGNGMVMSEVGPYEQVVIKGLVTVIAVSLTLDRRQVRIAK